MQVNLNPSINQSRASFKASFSNDVDTKVVIDDLKHVHNGTARILAAHYALNDIDSNDIIGLVHDLDRKGYYAKNLTNGKEIELSDKFGAEIASRLIEAVNDGELIDKKPKHEIGEYIYRAFDFIGVHSKKEDSILNKLEQQIKSLETKLNGLRDKFSTVRKKRIYNIANAVKKEIFSLAKK